MSNRIIKLTSREEMERSLETSDYVLQYLDEKSRADYEERLISDKDMQQDLTEELLLRRLIERAEPDFQISNGAFEKFSKELKKPKQSKRSFVFGTVAATLAILSFVLYFQPEPGINEFQTLSNGEFVLLSDEEKLSYTIIFSENTDELLRKKILAMYQFSLKSGPGTAGSFLIESEQPLSRKELDNIRNHQHILFIEPTVSIPTND